MNRLQENNAAGAVPGGRAAQAAGDGWGADGFRRTVQEHPLLSVAAALALGMVAARLAAR